MAEGKSHFLDTHRSALVQDISEVAKTLDMLLEKEMLTSEQYDNIKSEGTTQQKVRKLLDYSRGWNVSDKDDLCYCLRDENKKVAVFQHWKPIGGEKKTSISSPPPVKQPKRSQPPGKASKYTNVLDVECSGASEATAKRNGHKDIYGEEVSHAIAKRDEEAIRRLKDKIVRVGERRGIDPSLIAGLISRLSNAGALLRNGWGCGRECFGLMQVSKQWHTLRGEWNSEEHIDQGAEILAGMIGYIKGDFPDWTPAQHLKGGTAAYMCGNMQVHSYQDVDENTDCKDFSNDVIARAQWFKKNVFNS